MRVPIQLIRTARSAALVVAVVLIGVAMAQDRLLYYPDAASVPETLAATGSARARAWPATGDFRGVLAEPANAIPIRGTALIFHGNAGHTGHRGYYIDALTRQGLRVILAEYPGYGARPGKLGEPALVADAIETIALARRQFGGPLYLVGESLGAGVASAAAGRSEPIAGLLLITPWDTLANVASHHYPWLPVRWLLSDRYDSVAHLKAYPGPTVVVLAAEDRVVPARFGRALFAGLPGRKQLLVIAGADHNDWVDRVDDAWWRQVVEKLLAGR